jgi:radical SAM enzyme (TIGR01210 family)
MIREQAINKGFSFADYKKATMQLKKHKINVKTYVLMKPPFLTEKESIDDCFRTLRETKNLTQSISINPTNVQRNTVVDYLWKRNQYRPPWLWSIVEVLKQSNTITPASVKCDVVGGGSIRGAHNCGNCDSKVLHAIEEYSLTQKKEVFQNLSCDCQEHWLDQLNLEKLSFGSQVDFSRWRS